MKNNIPINNWYVITGAPCSGKTTILEELQKKGFYIVEEAARIYIDQELKKGKTLAQIRKDELAFQKKVLRLKIQIENKLPKDKMIFLERGIPDSTAYYKICGKIKDTFLDEANANCHYKKVFLLELLDYKKDYARIENKEKAIELEKLLEESYRNIRVPIIKIAKMSIDQRLKNILENL